MVMCCTVLYCKQDTVMFELYCAGTLYCIGSIISSCFMPLFNISSHLMIILYFGSTLQLTDSHISLLVHGVFNATISEAELKSHNYEYNESTNSW